MMAGSTSWPANHRRTGRLTHARPALGFRRVHASRDAQGSSNSTPRNTSRAAVVAVKVPVGVGFAKRAGLVRDGATEEVAAFAGRLTVFRFDPGD